MLLKMRRGPGVATIVILGLLLSVVGFYSLSARNEREAELWLEERGQLIHSAATQSVDRMFKDLRIVRSFLTTSPDAGSQDFDEFVRSMSPNPNIVGMVFAQVVPSSEFQEFLSEQRTRDPDYRITELDENGTLIPRVPEHDFCFPVRYLSAGPILDRLIQQSPLQSQQLIVGFDIGSNGEWNTALYRLMTSDSDGVATDFWELAPETSTRAFVVMLPIRAEDGSIKAVLIAPSLETQLTQAIESNITGKVTWQFERLDPAAIFQGSKDLIYWSKLEHPGVPWALRVEPTDEVLSEIAVWSPLGVLGVGLAVTTLLATLAHLAGERRRTRIDMTSLRRATEEQDRFLATVSHEIRTPLTAVNGLAREMIEREFDPEETRSLVGLIAEQSNEVAAIVEDLLLGARADIGKVKIFLDRVDPEKIVHQVSSMSPASVHVSGNSGEAWADPRRVRQILRNLLTNANRYGGPAVEVRLSANDSEVIISVADDGEPIPLDKQEEVFAPYASAHSRAEQLGSIGLGLYISRKLARLMGGDLRYRHDGAHSIFDLSLPRFVPGQSPSRVPSPGA